MERSRIGIRIGLGIAAILCAVGGAVAQPQEPLERADMRGLRSDYIKSWYIYSDVNQDGVLNPGDGTYKAGLDNWWTAIDSPAQAKQHDDPVGGYNFNNTNKPMTPLNFASAGGSGRTDYWLDKPKANRLSFYMTYSQWDNANAEWHAGLNHATIPGFGTYNSEQAANRGGWAMGWVNDAILRDAGGAVIDDETTKGYNYMDIYVHNGRNSGDIDTFPDSSYGKYSDSNPHVGMSNGINEDSLDPETHTRFVPMLDETTGTYNASANSARDQWYRNVQAHHGDPVTGFDVASVVGTMEVREVNPYHLMGETWTELCNASDTAAAIWASQGYTYNDAMIGRSDYSHNSTSGGMINGLASQITGTNYDEQQVIRIDLADLNLTYNDMGLPFAGLHDDAGVPLTGSSLISTVDEIMFYDFGYDAAAGQVVPIEILFRVDRTRTYNQGQVWLDVDGDGVFDVGDGDCYFAENRIFIGLMDPVPEPATMTLLASGTIGLLLRRRRKNRRS
ncbi:MAG: PEP-CTERM sorting domain-containing protein [Phycisphaerae bacterium]|nr:PEP-CTERM sorting domain-containing protein [Phycisphaerae bacterium]